MASDLHDVLLAEEGLQAGSPARIDIRSLNYYVKDDKGGERHILRNITDSLPAGKMTALMGASGSGKTSLLTLLRALGGAGSTSTGDVLYDNKPVTQGMVRSTTRFVAQEDVYLPGLTPRETLLFAAELRLPRKWTAQQRSQRVDTVLTLLNLQSCADTKVGDPRLNLPGCSGGERKRLSIASAIVGGLPSVLLCDEPTTGLDSASAEQVVKFLKQISTRGVTVVASIHQPSYPVFAEFEHLLLLDQGRMAYKGLISDAEAAFEKAGFPTPTHFNPADHYIKVVQTEEAWWKAETARTGEVQTTTRSKAKTVRKTSITMQGGFSTFKHQVAVLTRRNLRENFKNKKRFFAGVMSRLPASLLLGTFFWGVAAKSTQQYIFTTEAVFFVSVQNPIIDAFYGGLASFQQQRPIFKREYYDGMYSVAAFYISYYSAYFVMQVPWALVWTIPLYFFTGMPVELLRFVVFLMAVLVSIMFGTAWGSIIGASSADNDSGRAKFTPVFIPMVLFSGFVIPYATCAKIWRPMYLLSPMQWGLSILSRNVWIDREFIDCPRGMPRGCYPTGEDFLIANGRTYTIPTMFAICAAYAMLAVAYSVVSARRHVIDGRP
mmetsp:Transcript_6936/g.12326  ORF Transcript_6936/g.12326 Transcript_6936/m.12326 type:complete len:605 (-) Transcript_6936:60-1874(-)